jgi:hypothetical protein
MANAFDITVTGSPSVNATKAANVIIDKLITAADEKENIYYGDSAGSLPEITELQITAAATAAGESILTLNGTAYNVPLTATDIGTNVQEIISYIESSIPGYTAELSGEGDEVLITALFGGAQTDATYAAGTATSSAGTVNVTQQGADGTPYPAVSTSTEIYRVYEYNVLKEGQKYELTFVEQRPN